MGQYFLSYLFYKLQQILLHKKWINKVQVNNNINNKEEKYINLLWTSKLEFSIEFNGWIEKKYSIIILTEQFS